MAESFKKEDMNKEFHYYLVRLVAGRAGLRGKDLIRLRMTALKNRETLVGVKLICKYVFINNAIYV